MRDDIIYFSSQRASCKRLSVFVAVIVLLTGEITGLSLPNLLIAAMPLTLLAVIDAAYGATQMRYGDTLKEGGASISTLPPESAMTSILRTLSAMRSLSIWLFYLTLFGLIAIGSFGVRGKSAVPQRVTPVLNNATFESKQRSRTLSKQAGTSVSNFQTAKESTFTIEGLPKSSDQHTTSASVRHNAKPINYAARSIVNAPLNMSSGVRSTPAVVPTKTQNPNSR